MRSLLHALHETIGSSYGVDVPKAHIDVQRAALARMSMLDYILECLRGLGFYSLALAMPGGISCFVGVVWSRSKISILRKEYCQS